MRNLGGHLGAWVADASYFLLGFSAWWCLAAGLRAWLASLARWMRGEDAAGRATRRSTAAFWGGLALLLAASTGLEWSRLYRLEPHLPDHAGGALGATVGGWGVQWLGFTGSGLVFVALVVVGAALVFRFSWGQVAERLGARHRRLVRGAARAARAGRGRRARPAGGAPARGDRAGGAHRDRRAPSGAGADRAGQGRSAQERARGQGAPEAALHGAARFEAAAGGPAGHAARRARRR